MVKIMLRQHRQLLHDVEILSCPVLLHYGIVTLRHSQYSTVLYSTVHYSTVQHPPPLQHRDTRTLPRQGDLFLPQLSVEINETASHFVKPSSI